MTDLNDMANASAAKNADEGRLPLAGLKGHRPDTGALRRHGGSTPG
jgi:hypothetical protein